MKAKRRIKKKKNTKSILILSIISVVIFFFLIRSLTGRIYKNYKTTFPIYTSYVDEKTYKGVNILNEKVYTAKGEGIVIYSASEGQKVPANFEIASINLMNDTSELKDELAKVNAAIAYKTDGDKKEESKVEDISLKDLQDNIKKNNLSAAISDINNLDLSSNKNIAWSELTELMDYSLDALNAKRDELTEQINKSNIVYKSDTSSIVSFLIDGFENKYSLDKIEKMNYSYFTKNSEPLSRQSKTKVNKGDKLFKLIDNINYNVAILIKDNEDLKKIKDNDYLLLRFKDDTVRAKILTINESDKGSVVIVNLDRFFDQIYKQRVNDFDIVYKDQKCYEIPKSAIIKRDNIFGVYVQEIHGLVRFVPIKVIKPLEKTSYVSKGDRSSYIEIDNKKYKTISLNDPIIINPKQVEQSEILN